MGGVGKSLWRNKGALIGGTVGGLTGPVGAVGGAYVGSQFDPGKGDPFNQATASARANAYADKGKVGFGGGGLEWQRAPGPAPDMTDTILQSIDREAKLRLKTGKTRESMFK